jgi:hypothetical protein
VAGIDEGAGTAGRGRKGESFRSGGIPCLFGKIGEYLYAGRRYRGKKLAHERRKEEEPKAEEKGMEWNGSVDKFGRRE